MLKMGRLLGFQPSATDSQKFINACASAGTPLDTTQKNAITTLVNGLKSNGLWTKMDAIYPMIGGVSGTHKFNLKDPRDLDAAHRLTFIGSPTHASTGISWNGTTQYANTNLAPSSKFVNNSTHLSYYSRTNQAAGTFAEIGCQNATARAMIFTRRSSGNLESHLYDGGSTVMLAANPDSLGFFTASRASSTSNAAYRNGALLGTNTVASGVSPTVITTNVFLGCGSSTSGTATFYSTKECAFASIGKGLSGAEASTFYTLVQAYQTSLGRQV